jgi:hypothetical protein
VGVIQNHYVSVLEQSEACKDEIEGYGVFFARSDVRSPMTRTPYHSINVFWDTHRQYTPTRLFFSKPNQSFESYEPTCVLRVQKELDRGAESHSQLQIFPFLCATQYKGLIEIASVI